MIGNKSIKTFNELVTSIELMFQNIIDCSEDSNTRSKAMRRAEREFYQACDLSQTTKNWQKLQQLLKQLNDFKDKGYEFI